MKIENTDFSLALFGRRVPQLQSIKYKIFVMCFVGIYSGKAIFKRKWRIQPKYNKEPVYLGNLCLKSAQMELLGLMVLSWKTPRNLVLPIYTPLPTLGRQKWICLLNLLRKFSWKSCHSILLCITQWSSLPQSNAEQNIWQTFTQHTRPTITLIT